MYTQFLKVIRSGIHISMGIICATVMLSFQPAYSQSEDQAVDIDHAVVLNKLNESTLQQGKEIYSSACIACHGENGTASLPQARSFNRDTLKFGNDPYSMWKTVTNGVGMMAPQTYLTPEQRYYVIQYIREKLIKPFNPGQYFKVTEAYLSELPKPEKNEAEQAEEVKKGALKGLQKYGQEWFTNHSGDYGKAIYSQLQDETSAALTIKLQNHVNLSYNLLRMGLVAAWQGNLNLSETKFANYRGEGQPYVEGNPLSGLDTWQWAYQDSLANLEKAISPRAPLPEKWLQYHGHYQYGNQVVLSYRIHGREILEYPEVMVSHNLTVLSHTLEIGPGTTSEKIYVGKLEVNGEQVKEGLVALDGKFTEMKTPTGKAAGHLIVSSVLANETTGAFVAAGIIGADNDFEWSVDPQHRLLLNIPASKQTTLVRILRFAGKNQQELVQFGELVRASDTKKNIPQLARLTKGGPRVWGQTVTTQGQLDMVKPHYAPIYYEEEEKITPDKLVSIPKDYPYTVDDIVLPYANPWSAWIRPTSLDFLSDGRLILGTYLGDVWMASGLDHDLKTISWQRIATGLFEPMGIKVVDDQIYVTCRDRIVHLHDLNKDGETDFYESFHPDNDVSNFFHSFAFGLQTDSKGNFYYTKPGQYTSNADPGNVIKVSPDGKKWESIATGFRVDNGITITPEDKIFVSDNQGNWIPANKINLIEPGAYYGYVPDVVERGWSPDGITVDMGDAFQFFLGPEWVTIPETFHKPVIWMPQELDNSPGGGVWSDKSWGPLGDSFIHTSYGKGWLYHLLTQEVDGVTQGAIVALPFQLDAGIQRARVNPADKQIYVVGLTGWDDGFSEKYGVLNRIRYTGGEGHFIKNVSVTEDGLKITFNFSVDAATATNPSNFEIEQWNYMWERRYGSEHWSVENKYQRGHDQVLVQQVDLEEDGHSLLLKIPKIRPVDQMRIHLNVKAADGASYDDFIYLTIHKIPGNKMQSDAGRIGGK